MKTVLCLILIFLSLVLSNLNEYEHVSLTSVFKLQNAQYNTFLHSGSLSYHSGSYQQAVTGYADQSDLNSYWQILGKHGLQSQRGNPIKCGQKVRFQHVKTKKFLHSHQQKSPLSGKQEVSAFGNGPAGDGGDNWYVICNSNEKLWKRDSYVQFEHADTGSFLAMSGAKYRGAQGHSEVVGVDEDDLPSSKWKVEIGVFFTSETDAKSEL
uniref:Stromal cell-derived factor 2 (Trinotate prediction) n=1 Tax=Myxobolus squamalis TaxID=59785 RepID=A0A6B2FYN4_MYXSQ